jgi:hypothetical protein
MRELHGQVWQPLPVTLRIDQLSSVHAVLRVTVGAEGDGTVVAYFDDLRRGTCGSCHRACGHLLRPRDDRSVASMCGSCWLRLVMVRGFVSEFR